MIPSMIGMDTEVPYMFTIDAYFMKFLHIWRHSDFYDNVRLGAELVLKPRPPKLGWT